MQDESFNRIANDSGNGLLKERVEIVVAKCLGGTTWLTDMAQIITSYDKCGDESGPGKHSSLPNTGRQAGTYLSHIIANYDSLAEWIVFTQGGKPVWASNGQQPGGADMFKGQNFNHYVKAHANRQQQPSLVSHHDCVACRQCGPCATILLTDPFILPRAISAHSAYVPGSTATELILALL